MFNCSQKGVQKECLDGWRYMYTATGKEHSREVLRARISGTAVEATVALRSLRFCFHWRQGKLGHEW